MAQEIERKFLVGCDCFKQESYKSTHIIQGYLCSAPEHSVRVRMKGERAYLTIKGMSNSSGTTRLEWEKEISVDDAHSLLEICEPGIIDKTRFLVKGSDGIHTWEIDVFHGDNDGLIIAEIELSNENEAFDKPTWIGEEVTSKARYYNVMLAKNPYKNWK